VLTIAARTIGGPAYLETIEEMERELIKVIEDFDHAVNVEALCLVNKTSRFSLSNLSMVDPHGCLERAERERVEREQVGRERLE